MLIFQYLGTVDPATLELKPLIVKSLPEPVKVADGKFKGSLAYTFEFLDEAVWDNGTPVTAQDFIFTVKAIMNPHAGTGMWRGYFEHLLDIEPDPANPKKFTCYFKQFYILGLATLCQTPVFPKYNYDPKNLTDGSPLADLLDEKKRDAAGKSDPNLKAFADAFADQKFATDKNAISGSGGYQLESMQQGEGVILIKKKNYWGDKVVDKNPLLAAYPDKLVYRVVKDEPAIETLLRNGELDVAVNVSSEKFIELKNDAKLAAQYDFNTKEQTLYNQFLLNNRDLRLSDKRVRQALAYSIDYDYMVKDVSMNMAKRTVGPINPMKPYYNHDIVPYNLDIKKAQELLTAAGWKDMDNDGVLDKTIGGKKQSLKFKLLATTTSISTKKFAESIKETARKVGFDFEIVSVDLANLSKTTKEGNFETAVLAAATFPGPDDPHQSLHSKSLAPAGDNRSGFANKEADRLMDAIRIEQDMNKRTEFYKKLQVIINEDLPVIYLTCPMQRYITSKKFNAVISSNRPGYYESLFQLKAVNN